MYWDSLTATGVVISLVMSLSMLYLIIRDQPGSHRD
jgi:hypothetical protein